MYHTRYKICAEHAAATDMILNGAMVRFCQQCGRFQPMTDFDGPKRSCRRKLLMHNQQRKRVRDAKKEAAARHTPSSSPVASPRSQDGFVSPLGSPGPPAVLPLLLPLPGSPQSQISLRIAAAASPVPSPTERTPDSPDGPDMLPSIQHFVTQMSLDDIDLDAALAAMEDDAFPAMTRSTSHGAPSESPDVSAGGVGSMADLPQAENYGAVVIPTALHQRYYSLEAAAAPPDVARSLMLQVLVHGPPKGLAKLQLPLSDYSKSI